MPRTTDPLTIPPPRRIGTGRVAAFVAPTKAGGAAQAEVGRKRDRGQAEGVRGQRAFTLLSRERQITHEANQPQPRESVRPSWIGISTPRHRHLAAKPSTSAAPPAPPPPSSWPKINPRVCPKPRLKNLTCDVMRLNPLLRTCDTVPHQRTKTKSCI